MTPSAKICSLGRGVLGGVGERAQRQPAGDSDRCRVVDHFEGGQQRGVFVFVAAFPHADARQQGLDGEVVQVHVAVIVEFVDVGFGIDAFGIPGPDGVDLQQAGGLREVGDHAAERLGVGQLRRRVLVDARQVGDRVTALQVGASGQVAAPEQAYQVEVDVGPHGEQFALDDAVVDRVESVLPAVDVVEGVVDVGDHRVGFLPDLFDHFGGFRGFVVVAVEVVVVRGGVLAGVVLAAQYFDHVPRQVFAVEVGFAHGEVAADERLLEAFGRGVVGLGADFRRGRHVEPALARDGCEGCGGQKEVFDAVFHGFGGLC